MKNIYLQLLEKPEEAYPLVLATVTATSGSTPQKPGSTALFGLSGLMSGTVGGGILEGKVQQIVKKIINTKESGLYYFNLDNDISHQEGAICGGRAGILVDASPGDHLRVFKQMRNSLAQRIPGVLVTQAVKQCDNKAAVTRFWVAGSNKNALPAEHFEQLEPLVDDILAAGNPSDYREVKLNVDEQEAIFSLEAVFPLPQLIIAGAGHIGKALAHLGSLLDFEVTVIDDRAEYASRENLPDADHIIVENIGQSLHAISKTSDTYIVIVTRGHKDDAGALRACIGSEAAYTGMIGSTRKIALMKKQFLDEGWASPEQWDTVYAPIGLKIPGKTVQEIAVSIAAQLIEKRNSQVKG